MKIIFLLLMALSSLSLYAATGSSVQIPTREHMKFAFGNHKNHPVQKLEEKQYLASLAPLKEEEIKRNLVQNGYDIAGVQLRDIASELVYEAHVANSEGERLKLYIDPANGSILHRENMP